MYVVMSMMVAIAGCLVIFYGKGDLQVRVLETEAERRDALWFVVIMAVMLVVVAASLSTA